MQFCAFSFARFLKISLYYEFSLEKFLNGLQARIIYQNLQEIQALRVLTAKKLQFQSLKALSLFKISSLFRYKTLSMNFRCPKHIITSKNLQKVQKKFPEKGRSSLKTDPNQFKGQNSTFFPKIPSISYRKN